MTWSVLAALVGVGAVVAGAWWLGRDRPGAAPVPDAVGVADPTYRLTFRGYRMDQVDEVVDRLEARIASRENEIARLKGLDVMAPDAAAAGTTTPFAPPDRPPATADPEDDPPPDPVRQPGVTPLPDAPRR
ncbi:DivIVA domain-containing protein [Phycicoccus sp. HDW14]|uniref:DivIVA domain-containing protein n=1 Tax=Phycicoccus sp. HDW14 TaxID=2714941 RepID=UPI00140C09FD|nr:DivIVA domain-containing protein [Phycicoccus sp. HDW14]QIM20168.1 DivIVA domain-containing protein [Phycicoccus sp. HDW14]